MYLKPSNCNASILSGSSIATETIVKYDAVRHHGICEPANRTISELTIGSIKKSTNKNISPGDSRNQTTNRSIPATPADRTANSETP